MASQKRVNKIQRRKCGMRVEKAFKTAMSGRLLYFPTGMGGKPAIGMKTVCPFCSRTYWM